MDERLRGWWARLDKRAVIVLAVAAGIRLFWIFAVRSQPVSDFAFYFGRAAEVAAGKGYLLGDHPTAYWPPGYPFFLAVFFWLLGPHLIVAKLLNVAMWSASALLMFVLGKRVGGPVAGLVSGLVVALYPEYVYFSGLVASENLFVLVISIAVVLLVLEPASPRRRVVVAAVCGLLLGWGIIIRPASILLPLTLCVVLWLVRFRRQGFTTALVVGLCALAALAPWVIRNRIVMGEWVISTNGGASVWGGAHEGSTGTFMRQEEAPSWMRRANRIEDELRSNSEGSKAAMAYIREHPWEWLSLAPTKLFGLFDEPAGVDWNLVYYKPDALKPSVRPLGRFEQRVVKVATVYRRFPRWDLMRRFQALEWILGGLGLVVAIALKRKAAIWPFTVVAYSIVFQVTLATGQPRYLVSPGPLLAPGIGFLAALIVQWFHRRRFPVGVDVNAEDTVAA